MATANRKNAARPQPVAAGRTSRRATVADGEPAARLAPGTLCYLKGSGQRNADLIGRVVQVVNGPREEFGSGPGPYYEITAPWLSAAWIAARFQRPGVEITIVHRKFLVPITPDEPLEPEVATAEDDDLPARMRRLADRLLEVRRFCESIEDACPAAVRARGAA
jgi:hypothetical protein